MYHKEVHLHGLNRSGDKNPNSQQKIQRGVIFPTQLIIGIRFQKGAVQSIKRNLFEGYSS